MFRSQPGTETAREGAGFWYLLGPRGRDLATFGGELCAELRIAVGITESDQERGSGVGHPCPLKSG